MRFSYHVNVVGSSVFLIPNMILLISGFEHGKDLGHFMSNNFKMIKKKKKKNYPHLHLKWSLAINSTARSKKSSTNQKGCLFAKPKNRSCCVTRIERKRKVKTYLWTAERTWCFSIFPPTPEARSSAPDFDIFTIKYKLLLYKYTSQWIKEDPVLLIGRYP